VTPRPKGKLFGQLQYVFTGPTPLLTPNNLKEYMQKDNTTVLIYNKDVK